LLFYAPHCLLFCEDVGLDLSKTIMEKYSTWCTIFLFYNHSFQFSLRSTTPKTDIIVLLCSSNLGYNYCQKLVISAVEL